MTQPQSPNGLTYQDALAAVVAAQAVLSATDVVAATTAAASSGVIAARETAAAYAKTLILGLWDGLDPYDGHAVQAFTAAARKHMAAAQTATARAAAAGQSQILSKMGVRVPGVASNPVNVRAPAADVVDGRLVLDIPDSVRVDYDTRSDVRVDAEDFSTEGMFNRPVRTFRALQAQGAPATEADDQARQRFGLLIDDNLMLAQRFAELEIVQKAVNLDETVIGYRRVIHPELSRTGVCGLCLAAADQLYHVDTLLPIHSNCKCTIAAVTETHDPGDDVNAADLRELYRLGGGTGRAQLKRVRYQVDAHGELGPVLAPKRQYKPRGKKSAPAARADSSFDYNRDPERGITAPTFVGGDHKKITAEQKRASKSQLTALLAQLT